MPLPDIDPTIMVVIDTEEEFDWSGGFDPANVGVSNIQDQHFAQDVFRKHGVVPTYAVDYPVATTASAIEVLSRFHEAGECEIGAHLHPWVTPPDRRVVPNRDSYPGNLPPEVERAKLSALTDAIEAAFHVRPTIYKAGRYGVGPSSAGILHDLGYRTDVSIVPHTNFSADGGPDFSAIPDRPLRFGPGVAGLPLSVGFAGVFGALGGALYPALASSPSIVRGIASRLRLLERLRLSPEGHTTEEMLRLVRTGLARGQRLFMLTYHSSSLLPGGAPYVRDKASRAAFVKTLDDVLSTFLGPLGGRTAAVSAMAARLDPALR